MDERSDRRQVVFAHFCSETRTKVVFVVVDLNLGLDPKVTVRVSVSEVDALQETRVKQTEVKQDSFHLCGFC